MSNDELRCVYSVAKDRAQQYSAQVQMLRLTVITVGLLVFAACGKVILDNQSRWFSFAGSAWGLLFVVALFMLIHHKRIHAITCYRFAESIEKKLLESHDVQSSLWGNILGDHDQLQTNFIAWVLYFYGTFLVMAIGFVGFMIYSIVYIIMN